MKTIFEKIVGGEIPSHKIYEDDNFFAFLDIFPKKKGHTLVITKKPFKNLLEIPKAISDKYLQVVQKIAIAVVIGTKADGFNLVMNNSEAAGQEVFHVHFHIIPRYKNDAVDLNPGTHEEYSNPEEMEEFKNKIVNSL